MILSSKFDVVVVGSGCAGLFVLEALSKLGLKTLLVECEEKLANGPSIRNGAYIHAGSYHSASLSEYIKSRETVKACMEGAARFRRLFPEAILHQGLPVHMLARYKENAELALKRWDEFGVEYKLKTSTELKKRYPALDVTKSILGAEVADFHVNWRIVFQKLLISAQNNGAEIAMRAQVEVKDDGLIHLHKSDGQNQKILAQKIIYCTGYGTEKLLRMNKKRFMKPPHLKLWRSHVLVLPALEKIGWMYVDPGQVSVTPQLGHTLVCQAKEEEPVPQAIFEPCAISLSRIAAAFNDIVPNHQDILDRAIGHSCIKVSIGDNDQFERNVDYTISSVSELEMIALPGKSSAAPVLADAVVQSVFSSNFGSDLALSPGSISFGE